MFKLAWMLIPHTVFMSFMSFVMMMHIAQ